MTHRERDRDHRAPPAVVGLLDQREDEAAQPERTQGRSDDVHPPALDLRRLGTAARTSTSVPSTSRHVEGEDPAPRELIDDPASREWADDRRDPTPCSPGADRRATLLRARMRQR